MAWLDRLIVPRRPTNMRAIEGSKRVTTQMSKGARLGDAAEGTAGCIGLLLLLALGGLYPGSNCSDGLGVALPVRLKRERGAPRTGEV